MGDKMLEYKYFLSVAFSICALIFIIQIFIMYIFKKKFRSVENSVFKYLLITNAFTILLEFIYTYCLSHSDSITSFTIFICRTYHAGLIFWALLFIFYILTLMTRSIKNARKKKDVRRMILAGIVVVYAISIIMMFSFPLEFYNYNTNLYVFGGPSSYIPLTLGAIGLITMIIGILLNKEIEKEQKVPIYFCSIILILMIIIQYGVLKINYNLENFMFTIILMTLYFTLENQDNMLLDELEDYQKQAEIADKEQTAFLTNMSHEIRTPMNSILGFSESLLYEKELTEAIVKKDMEYIHNAAVVLLMLINNILDISRIESGRERVIRKEYDLKSLLLDVNSLMKSKTNNNISFNIKVDENLPKEYKGDSTKINKIVTNTLLNALNYTNFGKISLEVLPVNHKNDQLDLRFIITNSGNAMKEEDFEKDFNDFVNIGVSQDNMVSSVTLGLMVAKQLVHMMNGSIKFINDQGKETKYLITIPQDIVDQNPIGDIFKDQDQPEQKLLDLKGKKVLVVDDNRVNLKLAIRLLEGYQIIIDTATSGRECVEKVKNNRYDMIFLDHMMPEMDGLETLNHLKSYGYKLPPVIALTANSYAGIREQYIEQGFSDYLSKPINYKDLNKIMYDFFKNEESVSIYSSRPTIEAIDDETII